MSPPARFVTSAIGFAVSLLAIACGNANSLPSLLAPSPVPFRNGATSTVSSDATFTLSGVVSEQTVSGTIPIGDVAIEVAVCPRPGFSSAQTAKTVTNVSGFYTVSGMCTGTTYVWLSKDGYKTSPTGQCDGDCLYATIDGDTRFDVTLARR
jgi:hypothetical protein